MKTKKVYVRVNEKFWVQHSWGSIGKFQLGLEPEETIDADEVKFLKKHFKTVEVYENRMVKVEKV